MSESPSPWPGIRRSPIKLAVAVCLHEDSVPQFQVGKFCQQFQGTLGISTPVAVVKRVLGSRLCASGWPSVISADIITFPCSARPKLHVRQALYSRVAFG